MQHCTCTQPKGETKSIGHNLEGDSLLRMVIERKWREADKRKTKTDHTVLDANRCIGSLKKRPSSERSGNFDQWNLLRKQRIGRRTNKLEILFHTELMTRKEEQDINAKYFWLRIDNWHRTFGCIAGNELNKFIRWQLCLKISEGPSRPPVNRHATPTGVATHRLRTAVLGQCIIRAFNHEYSSPPRPRCSCISSRSYLARFTEWWSHGCSCCLSSVPCKTFILSFMTSEYSRSQHPPKHAKL